MNEYAQTVVVPGISSQFEIKIIEPQLPKAGELLIQHHCIGVNFIDIYHRTGIYPLSAYPAVIGAEASGVILAVGPDVQGFTVGNRVAYAGQPFGAYSSTRLIPAEKAIILPDNVTHRTAASSLIKGMTSYMLMHETYAVRAGTQILLPAAAGGLGGVLTRLATRLGASVIGTVSTEEKAQLAQLNGAEHLIIGRDADIVSEVHRLTDGKLVDVAYDGVGGSMLMKSIQSVKPFGVIAAIGQAGGSPPPVSIEDLRPGKALINPSLMAWSSNIDNYRKAASAAIEAMQQGVTSTIGAEYSLRDAQQAHELLASGKLVGSIILIP